MSRSPSFGRLSVRTQLACVCACLILLGALAVSAAPGLVSALNGRRPAVNKTFEGGTPAAALATRAGGRVEVETLTLRPSGFEPASLTRTQGEFILAVYNHAGVEDLGFVLTHETGRKEREARPPRGRQKKWAEALDLAPGSYTLSVADHPEWMCDITITPR